MSDQTKPTEEPRFRDLVDDAGKAWLDEIIEAVRAGGYEEIAKRVAVDEEAIERELAS